MLEIEVASTYSTLKKILENEEIGEDGAVGEVITRMEGIMEIIVDADTMMKNRDVEKVETMDLMQVYMMMMLGWVQEILVRGEAVIVVMASNMFDLDRKEDKMEGSSSLKGQTKGRDGDVVIEIEVHRQDEKVHQMDVWKLITKRMSRQKEEDDSDNEVPHREEEVGWWKKGIRLPTKARNSFPKRSPSTIPRTSPPNSDLH